MAKLKQLGCQILSVSLFLLISIPALAYRPLTTKVDIGGIYPKYPKIDYGTGDQAKLLKRGEYLAKAGDCIACHTNAPENGKPYAGGLAINTPFGTFYTPNISPDKETGIGNWTEDQFITAMQQGTAPDGSNYFPVFPYLYFTKISKDDLRAIFAYLKALPPIKQKNKELPFPFNLPGARLSLLGWKFMFFNAHKGEYKYNADRSAEWNRGAYLVAGLGHCGMCHTPLTLAGSPKWQYFLTGGFIDGYWAPNITSYGLKTASRYEVADIFVDGKLINKAGPVAGPMSEVNHDSLQYLTEKDRLAIATYLKTVETQSPLGVPPYEKQSVLKRGAQVYGNVCVICHQNGQAGAPLIGDESNWKLRSKQGLPALYRHAINGYNNMPPKGACVTCSDNDIKSAVQYLLYKSLTTKQFNRVKNPRKPIKVTRNSAKNIYDNHCAVCHNKGVGGAQKIGDTAVWTALLNDKGMDNLILNTINGYHGMPKMGGCKHCTMDEVKAAVKYIVQNSVKGTDLSLW